MRIPAGTLMIAAVLCAGQEADQVDFRHLFTFGSKLGIHPPKVLNRKVAKGALGEGDHPYGLVFPVAVTTDLHHRVWIADGVTASVQVFDPEGGSYREIRRAADLMLRQPSGIASDNQGRVYVSDALGGFILVFDETGEFDHALMKRERLLESPGAIAISEDSKSIYVADPPRNVIVELNREGEINSTIQLPAEFRDPTGIAVVHNQIYVLGGQEHRVGIFSPAGRLRGEMRWDGIAFPTAFAYDAPRNRFVVVNPRWALIQVMREDGTTIGFFGQQGEGVDQMQRVDYLHVDSRGYVYVVDSRHGKVLVFGDPQQP